MRKSIKVLLIALSVASATALGVGVTYAASYVAPPEETSYEFGSMSASDYNFQDLSYYFDKDSGIATYNATGNGSKTAYTLDAAPTSIVSATVGGTSASYTYAGSVVTFASAPASGKDIVIIYRTRPGTSVAPFIVKNSQHLRNLAKLQNSGAFLDGQYVSLGTSFQYEGDAMEPIGTSTYPFTGVFNGNSYVITKLKVSTSTLTNVGMFGVLGTNTRTGTVHSLVLAGPDIRYTGSSAVKIGIVAGSRNNTVGHVSVIENIEIYGGTSGFNNMRAHIRTGSGSVTSGVIVGENGASGNAGFVNSISGSPTYTSTKNYGTALTASSDYYLWLNGENVDNSN